MVVTVIRFPIGLEPHHGLHDVRRHPQCVHLRDLVKGMVIKHACASFGAGPLSIGRQELHRSRLEGPVCLWTLMNSPPQELQEQARRAVAVADSLGSAYGRANARFQLALINARFGDLDAAITQLSELMRMPSQYSEDFLKVHPGFAPLRSNARFESLVNGP